MKFESKLIFPSMVSNYWIVLDLRVKKIGDFFVFNVLDGSSPCDKVFNTFKCHYETDPAVKTIQTSPASNNFLKPMFFFYFFFFQHFFLV